MLKPLNQVLEPDGRYAHFARVDLATGTVRPLQLADHYESIAEIELPDSVPDEIRRQFDKARNVFIYAWFDYDLVPVSDGLGYAAVELALRSRALAEGERPEPGRGLKHLLSIAIEKRWLLDEQFPSVIRARERAGASPHPDPQAYCRGLLETMPYLRNEFAHGNYYVFAPGNAISGLELCAEIIAQLFPRYD